jgi:hypothetical protein
MEWKEAKARLEWLAGGEPVRGVCLPAAAALRRVAELEAVVAAGPWDAWKVEQTARLAAETKLAEETEAQDGALHLLHLQIDEAEAKLAESQAEVGRLSRLVINRGGDTLDAEMRAEQAQAEVERLKDQHENELAVMGTCIRTRNTAEAALAAERERSERSLRDILLLLEVWVIAEPLGSVAREAYGHAATLVRKELGERDAAAQNASAPEGKP